VAKLSDPQQALLDEIRGGAGLYIKRWSQYQRTIDALERRGLVRCDEPDYSRLRMAHWVATNPTAEKGS
jgi:hypothetical protein